MLDLVRSLISQTKFLFSKSFIVSSGRPIITSVEIFLKPTERISLYALKKSSTFMKTAEENISRTKDMFSGSKSIFAKYMDSPRYQVLLWTFFSIIWTVLSHSFFAKHMDNPQSYFLCQIYGQSTLLFFFCTSSYKFTSRSYLCLYIYILLTCPLGTFMS